MSDTKLISDLVEAAYNRLNEEFDSKHQKTKLGEKGTARLNFTPLAKNAPTYAKYFEKNKDDSAVPSLRDLDRDMFIFYDALNYIKMSPRKKNDHQIAYVINQKGTKIENISAFLETRKTIELNESAVLLNQIFDFWKTKARDLLGYDSSSPLDKIKLVQLTKFLVLGPPGVGKTALLNYIFSIRAEELLKENILWVRVDLNDQKNIYLMLKYRFAAKFIKIFASYYFNNPRFEFDESFLNQNLKPILSEKLIPYLKKETSFDTCFERLIQLFQDIWKAERDNRFYDIPTNLIYYDLNLPLASKIVEVIMEFMQEKLNYSFIIIYDGLDSVTFDLIQYEQYTAWLKEISAITDIESTKYKALYIITMRDYSFINYFLKVMKAENLTQKQYVFGTVIQQDLDDILTKRVELIAHKFSQRGTQTSRHFLITIKNNLLDIVNASFYGLSMKEFSSKYVEAGLDRAEYDKLRGVCGNNYREILRFMRMLIVLLCKLLGGRAFSILSSGSGHDKCLRYLDGKEWLIDRLMLFGTFGSVYQNRLIYDINGNPEFNSNNCAIIPNLFNFKDSGPLIKESIPRNLLKLRVIQLLRENKIISIVSLVQKLNSIYHTDGRLIRADLREMIYAGLLEPLIEDYDFIAAEEHRANYNVRLRELGLIIWEGILKESIYYEIVCDDTPIDINYIDGIAPSNREDISLSMQEYLLAKTRSVFNFLFYLKTVERIEIQNFDPRNPFCQDYRIFKQGFIDDIKEQVKKYLIFYYRSLDNKKEFIEDFGRYYNLMKIK